MLDFPTDQSWMLIALIFFGVLFFVVWMRWRDQRWIENRFGKEGIMAVSFGVEYYEKIKDSDRIKRHSGFLLLLSDRLFFRSRKAKIQVEITRSCASRVYHDHVLQGIELNQSVVKLDFISAAGQADSAAFKVPYPPNGSRLLKTPFSWGIKD